MTSLVSLIENIAPGMYIICMGGILWMAYRLIHARRDLAMAQFKLEREQALVRQASAITIGGLLLETLIGVWAIANLMAPTLRDIQVGNDPIQAQAPERFVTSTPAANAPLSLDAGPAGDEGPELFATPVPTQTPVGTIIPDAPEVVGCPRDSAWLLIPGNGQRIFETTTVQGTAQVANFAFFRFEIRPTGAGEQLRVLSSDTTEPVVNGPLGVIEPRLIGNGEYRFRLAVFDNTRTMRAVCEVTIHITEPPPTATPIGAGIATFTPEPE